jgi:hypothetical protein
VRGDLAPLADRDVFLHLYEGTDFRVIADAAAVEIHQIAMEDDHALAKDDVVRDRHYS